MNALKSYRRRRNLTQEQVASLLSICQGTVSLSEKFGSVTPRTAKRALLLPDLSPKERKAFEAMAEV